MRFPQDLQPIDENSLSLTKQQELKKVKEIAVEFSYMKEIVFVNDYVMHSTGEFIFEDENGRYYTLTQNLNSFQEVFPLDGWLKQEDLIQEFFNNPSDETLEEISSIISIDKIEMAEIPPCIENLAQKDLIGTGETTPIVRVCKNQYFIYLESAYLKYMLDDKLHPGVLNDLKLKTHSVSYIILKKAIPYFYKTMFSLENHIPQRDIPKVLAFFKNKPIVHIHGLAPIELNYKLITPSTGEIRLKLYEMLHKGTQKLVEERLKTDHGTTAPSRFKQAFESQSFIKAANVHFSENNLFELERTR